MLYNVIWFIAALGATYMFSRQTLHIKSTWHSGVNRIIVAHLLSLAGCVVISLFLGLMIQLNGGRYPVGLATKTLMMFLLPQLIWLIYDLIRRRRRKAGHVWR